MLKPDLTIHDYLRILKKRKYIIMLSVITVILFSYFFSMFKPIVYTSKVDVTFNYNKAISSMVNEMAFRLPTNLNTMAQIIRRTSVIEKAAMGMGLIMPDDNIEKRDKVVRDILGMIRTSINSTSEIISIIITHSDPVSCARIANHIAAAFQDDVKLRNSDEIMKAREFIEGQLKDTQKKLDEVETRIENFRRDNSVVDINIELQSLLQVLNRMRNDQANLAAERNTLEMKLHTYANSKGIHRNNIQKIMGSEVTRAIRNQIMDEEIIGVTLKNKFKETHPSRDLNRQKIQRLKDKLVQSLSEDFDLAVVQYGVEIQTMKAREAAFENMIEKIESQVNRFPVLKAKIRRFVENSNLYRDMIKSYNKKIEELGVLEAEKVSQAPDIINRASIPDKPVTANRVFILIIGALSGIVIGFFMAFLVETLDVSVSTVEDVEDYIQVPVLGILPYITDIEDDQIETLEHKEGLLSRDCIAYYKPQAILSEALRIVRTNLNFKQEKKEKKTILVTSSLPGEGKTFVSANLALIYAQLGAKVLLMDMNLRDPEIHDYFGISKNPGITDVLIGGFNVVEAVRGTGVQGLDVITSGPIPPNPSELIESEAYVQMLEQLMDMYDVIVSDSPPYLPVADSSILVKIFKQTVFVHNTIKTGINILQRSKLGLENSGCRIDGIVLNQLKSTLFMDTDAQVNYYYRKKNKDED